MCPHSLQSVWDSPWGTGSQGESPPCTQIHLTCFAVVSKLDEHLWTRMIIIPWKDELINNYNNERAGVITPVVFSTCHLRNMGWAVDVTSRTLPTLFWDREGQRSVTKKACLEEGWSRRNYCRRGSSEMWRLWVSETRALPGRKGPDCLFSPGPLLSPGHCPGLPHQCALFLFTPSFVLL